MPTRTHPHGGYRRQSGDGMSYEAATGPPIDEAALEMGVLFCAIIADSAEIVRLYDLCGWVGQRDKPLQNELGWADAMVRADVARRRHWLLICCALTCCRYD
jgi:hypothetical protein